MKPPKILCPGEISKLNEYIYEKTGCFAFLFAGGAWKYAEPKSGKAAFELWSVALYTVYHDYGCGFLSYLLDEQNLPDKGLTNDIRKSKAHVSSVCNIFRNNIAHGVMDKNSRTTFQYQVSKFYLRNPSREGAWISYFDALTDDDWTKIATKLREESDELLEVLRRWADAFKSGSVLVALLRPRQNFGESAYFTSSLSQRLIFDSLDKDYVKRGDKNAREIMDIDLDKTLDEWKEDIRTKFLKNELKKPEDIINELRNRLFLVHNSPSESILNVATQTGFSLDSLV